MYDYQRDFAVCSASHLASIAGCTAQYNSRNFVAEKFITEFESVLGEKLERRKFNGNDYSFKDSKARELRLKLPHLIANSITAEIIFSAKEKYDSMKEPVYFISGESWSVVQAVKRYRNRAKEYSTKLLSSPQVSGLNRPILEYLDSLKTNTYSPFLENVRSALDDVRFELSLNPGEDRNRAIERNLIHFLNQGTIRPIYTVNENRPRVFAMEYSLLTLPN